MGETDSRLVEGNKKFREIEMDRRMDGVVRGTLSVNEYGRHLEVGCFNHCDGAFRAPKPLLVVGELLELDDVLNFDAVLVNPVRVSDLDLSLHGMVRQPGHFYGHGVGFQHLRSGCGA